MRAVFEHLEERGRSCPLAALGGELARLDGAARREANYAVERMNDILREDGEGYGQGLAVMSLILGTVTLARLAETEEDAETVLDTGRTAVNLLRRNWKEDA